MSAIEIFRKARNNFYSGPLKTPEEMEAYYVERQDEALAEMKESLLTEDNPLKILYTGHIGSGKSTELNKLSCDEEILKKFIVAPFSILRDYDPYDISYQDILLAIGSEIFSKARQINLKLSKRFLDQLDKAKDTVIKTETETTGSEAAVEAKISAWFATLAGRLKGEHAMKAEVRREITPKLSQLVRLIDAIIAEAERKDKQGRKLLVIVDDTDKPTLELAQSLFYLNGQILARPQCRIIYTIPAALLYHENSTAMRAYFSGDIFTLPNIRIVNKDGTDHADGIELMKEFIKKRLSLDYIKEDALRQAILMSGGVLREMGTIMRFACRKAIVRKEDKISLRTINSVVSEMRSEHQKSLSKTDYEILARKANDKRLERDGELRDLLHNLKVLEYRNDESWCDVNPIIKPLLVMV
ncbi:MAG: hypothetical protein GY862_07235 [Gammaproteobacteria bacterium]|nr:hypothetical protein [Gammaproteobacteria bacterium]